MRLRRVIAKLTPYMVACGLLAATLVQHDIAADSVDEDLGTPKVVVDQFAVPTVRTDVPVDPAGAGDAGHSDAAHRHAEGGAEANPDGSSSEPSEQSPVVIAELTPREVDPFALVGVTWASGVPAAAEVLVRWRGKDGWSDWTELHQENLTPAEGRPGTEPLWVQWADAVAVRLVSPERAVPQDLQIAAVDPGDIRGIAPMAAAQPGIIMRSQWGARSANSCSEPRYGPSTQGAVVHHTVGSNSYSQADSANIVRSIQAYHMDANDWCDIGYNFLVDRYGQIFEGRTGGIDRPVRGAHAGDDAVNQQTVGVALMGDFRTVDATAAMKSSTAKLVAWRFSLAGIPAKGTVSIGGKVLNRISGHRNVVSTACPGQIVYNWIGAAGGLRDQVAQILATGSARSPLPPAANGSVYRFWSPKFDNAHFFTMSRTEAERINSSDYNWTFEGVAFKALPTSAGRCTSGSPIFRFYSARFASHFYTSSQTEANRVKATDSNWKYEGIAYCAYLKPTAGAIPLYRFWSPTFGKHFYTAGKAEADRIRATDRNWTYEGIAYYVLP